VILVDAGPLVALLSANDQHRRRCTEALKKIRQPLATVWPAITEAMHLLAIRPTAQAALLERLESGALGLLPLDRTDVPRLRDLMTKYADRTMDLADAALVRVAEREGLDTIFTIDRADFTVYRQHGRARFRIIPA
jgi:predicted nucleic acid-binding protein